MTKSPQTPAAYNVGYGKPPEHSQFKPGQSGNPKGKPTGMPTHDELFLREAARLAKIQTGNKIEAISLIQLVYRQLYKMAASGDIRAIGLVIANFMRLNSMETTSGGSGDVPLVDVVLPDDDTIQRMLQRVAHLSPQSGGTDAKE